jgi:chemotaxis signal transduction protein
VTLSILPLVLEGRSIALAAEHVVEIVGGQPWVPLPKTRRELPGVCAWRGRAIAVLDIAALSGGLKPLSPGEVRARTVVASVDRVTLALPVDSVHEVCSVDESQLAPSRLTDQAFTRHELKIDARTVAPVLDLEALVADFSNGAEP